MPKTKPLVVDFTLESEALQVVSRLPLLSSSHKLGWGHGIHIEYYRHHAWETPEYCQTHHAIVVHHLEHTTEHTTKTERAKQLLHRPLSIADIALQCGFANQSHLNLRFKQLVGVTPKNFRKK